MFKLATGIMLSGLMLISLQLRAQTNEEIYNATIKQVDTAGLTLQYARHIDISRKLQENFNTLIKPMPENVIQATNLPLVQLSLNILLKLVNIDSIQAHAVSCVLDESDKANPYLYKSFIYTGANPQGLGYEMYSRTNKPFTLLKEIPPNTRFAFGAHVSYNKGWDYLVKELAKEPFPVLQQLPAMLDSQLEAKSGVKTSDIQKSMEGELLLLITSAGTAEAPEFRALCIVPDKDDTIKNLILARGGARLLQMGENTYDLLLPGKAPDWIKPRIIFGDKKLTVVSNPDILDTIAKPTEGARKITESGILFNYIDINENTLQLLASKERPIEFLRIFNMPRLYAVASVSELGYNNVMRASAELPGITDANTLQLALFAGVLTKAAKRISPPIPQKQQETCATNLKQFGLALHQYASDNDEVFPRPDNEAGLKILFDQGYLSDKSLLSSPDNPSNQNGYYYIGGFKLTEIRPPSIVPLAFDRPGNHPGLVHVLFVDGHVASMPIDNYKSPADVLNVLNAKFTYPPELLNDLTTRFKKLEP